jgi:polyhydroxyalkanoate synthesis regulator phasin
MSAENKSPGVGQTLKKGVLAGIGAIDLSIEKARQAVDKLVERGEITADQGGKFLDELIERGRKDSADISKKIDENVRKALEKVSFASKTSLQALEARVDEVERKIEELSKRLS